MLDAKNASTRGFRPPGGLLAILVLGASTAQVACTDTCEYNCAAYAAAYPYYYYPYEMETYYDPYYGAYYTRAPLTEDGGNPGDGGPTSTQVPDLVARARDGAAIVNQGI